MAEQETGAEAGAAPCAPVARLPDPAERRLLDGLAAQDPAALGALFEEHAEALARLVVGPRLRDREQVQDVLQDTFLTAFEKGKAFRWRGVGFFQWLRAIALNKIRSLWRDRARTAERTIPLESVVPWLTGDEGPDRRILTSERLVAVRARVAACLGQLSERDRQVLALRVVEGKARQETADALGVTVPHLDVLVYRAVRRFRALYLADGEVDHAD